MGQQEEIKGEEETPLKDKLRPLDITKFSGFYHESEVLFAPLSSFKINSVPEIVEDDAGFQYYQVMLEYIDTFIPTKEMLFMNVTNAF
jgi:hypothetical protein